MYKTVIFDLDGTLVDSDYSNMMSLKSAIFNIEGKDVPLEDVKKQSGVPGLQCLLNLGVVKIEETFNEWDKEFFRMKGRALYFGGIEDVILKLRELGVFIGIVTSRNDHEYEAFFSHLDLFDKFNTIIFASDTKNHKPHPEPILAFLKRANREKQGAIYIGDTVHDRDSAIAAGVDFAFAGWSDHNVKSDIILKKPSDILDMV